ncbi:hypothetical protein [Enterobacter sp. ENT03]|uniref:hypothetical protein n=1 Tax=Enterobacter sp. ENT03 TaxID=2854780 RepID=UPI001C465F5C|nr:hypothetical protein [Enterobacter sp. ENT03]MBV7404492.1 hypothetical protein [Enterobacter sp. ENT03]
MNKFGGWSFNPTVNKNIPAMQVEHLDIFNQAFEGFDGAGYEPLMHLGQQLVSGMNHSFIAKQSLLTSSPEHIAVVKVTIYVPLDAAPVITAIEAI